MRISNDLANALIGLELGGVAYPAPAAHHVALFAGDPFAGGVELSGGGYGRVQVTNSSANWSAPSTGMVQNAAPIQFPDVSGSPGTATHVALMSAPVGGAPKLAGPLEAPITLVNGMSPKFSPGTLRVTLSSAA